MCVTILLHVCLSPIYVYSLPTSLEEGVGSTVCSSTLSYFSRILFGSLLSFRINYFKVKLSIHLLVAICFSSNVFNKYFECEYCTKLF